MSSKATDTQLKKAFDAHTDETKDQITKLKKVFSILDKEPEREECKAIEGLLEEGDELISESQSGLIRDAALIAAAQKVEHYEIASYGALCSIAKKLGHDEAAKILHQILDEEKETDNKLSDIARDVEEHACPQAA